MTQPPTRPDGGEEIDWKDVAHLRLRQLEAIAEWFLMSAPCDIDGRTFEVLMAAGRRKHEASAPHPSTPQPKEGER